MTAAVLDTNTIVSAMLVPVGMSGQLLTHARDRHFTVATSSPILTEVFRVLSYPRIQRKYHVIPSDMARLRRFLQRRAIVTPLTRETHGVATHPEADLILATAASAYADYLVTGDRHLRCPIFGQPWDR